MKTRVNTNKDSGLKASPDHLNKAPAGKPGTAAAALPATSGQPAAAPAAAPGGRAHPTSNPAPQWRGVFLDGPQPDQDKEGDDHNSRSERPVWGSHFVAGLGSQIPVWLVYIGNEEAEPIGTVYHVYNLARAQALARRIAQDRNLELTDEAMPA